MGMCRIGARSLQVRTECGMGFIGYHDLQVGDQIFHPEQAHRPLGQHDLAITPMEITEMTLLVFGIKIASSIGAIFVYDMYGRKNPALIGVALSAAGSFIVASGGYAPPLVSLGGIVMTLVGYSLSFGPLSWMFP